MVEQYKKTIEKISNDSKNLMSQIKSNLIELFIQNGFDEIHNNNLTFDRVMVVHKKSRIGFIIDSSDTVLSTCSDQALRSSLNLSIIILSGNEVHNTGYRMPYNFLKSEPKEILDKILDKKFFNKIYKYYPKSKEILKAYQRELKIEDVLK